MHVPVASLEHLAAALGGQDVGCLLFPLALVLLLLRGNGGQLALIGAHGGDEAGRRRGDGGAGLAAAGGPGDEI